MSFEERSKKDSTEKNHKHLETNKREKNININNGPTNNSTQMKKEKQHMNI